MICEETSRYFSNALAIDICCAVKSTTSDYASESIAAKQALEEVGVSLLGAAFTQPKTFPNQRFSKSHSAGQAWACGALEQAGVGIDIEQKRTVDTAIHRFMIDPKVERQWVTESSDPLELFKVWTAKEALFKSDISNQGKVLTDYVIESMSTSVQPGTARSDSKRFTFHSRIDESAVLTVATPIGDNNE